MKTTASAAQNRKQDEPAQVATRIEHLVQVHSLSVIAQRTSTPITNVHRYMRGAKVPADFCARVVREFNVNPAWLLNGEGAASLTDVTTSTERMAGNLLELVEAMNAVMHMRMGALTGKHHLRVLRELNDALTRYEQLRERLNEHAQPIFGRLSEELQAALNRLDIERAADLFKPVDQVVRLCLDTRAEKIHLAMKSHFAVLSRNRAEALRLQQRLFRNPLSEGRIDSEEHCEEATRLLITLTDAGREPDALRVGEASMLLADDSTRATAGFAMLAMMTGNLMIHTGRLHEGLACIQRNLARVTNEGRRRAGRHMVMMGLLYGGVLQPGQAFEYGDHYDVKAFDMVSLAALLEDPKLLRSALAYRREARIETAVVYRPFDYITDAAAALLHALERDASRAESEWRRASEKWKDADAEPELAISHAQLLRLLNRNATKAHNRAADLLAGMKDRKLGLLQRVLHWRNALAIKGAKDRDEAQARLRQYQAAGYELFRNLG
ncbi:MAG: hypothetical protein IPK87_15580 [Planctomycetes bacterium]|nr:hypothetical protein [Planctomycetota bacterium]